MAKFIEIIDNLGVNHCVNIAKIEQVYELVVNDKNTCIVLTHDRIIVRASYKDIVKMLNKKGGFSWQ